MASLISWGALACSETHTDGSSDSGLGVPDVAPAARDASAADILVPSGPDVGDTGPFGGGNAGVPDAGDAGMQDAGDAGIPDVGDTGPHDGGDTGVPDVGDTGVPDLGDAGVPDLGDAGVPDLGDAGMPDLGDAGAADLGSGPCTPPFGWTCDAIAQCGCRAPNECIIVDQAGTARCQLHNGTRAPGVACNFGTPCVAGAVCAVAVGGGILQCRQLCDMANPSCGPGESCGPIRAFPSGAGVCLPATISGAIYVGP